MKFVGVRVVAQPYDYEVLVQEDGEEHILLIINGVVQDDVTPEVSHFAQECFNAWCEGRAYSHNGTNMA
jgi:hypothetical protein